MKWKKWLYITLMILGFCLIGAAFLLRDSGVSDNVGGTIMGAAGTLIGISIGQLLSLWAEKTDPAGARRKEIEVKDERNVAIRRRAKALSGDILQWSLLVVIWIALGAGAPLWVSILAITVFILKSVLEGCLILRYQREM